MTRIRREASERKQGQGTSSSSKSKPVVEVVETVSARSYEQLQQMKKNTTRLKPVSRSKSEMIKRSSRFWLGKTRKEEKTPISPQKCSEKVHLEPAKRGCMEECKIKVERKGKEVECGRLCDLEGPHEVCRCKVHKKPKSPVRREKLPVRTKGWRQCVEDCPHQEWPEEPGCGEQCCLPHPHEDMRKDHVCKKHCKETFPTLWKM